MKPIIIFSILQFGLSASLFPQNAVENLLDSSKQWNILVSVWENSEISNSLLYENTIAKRLKGDTIINGKDYLILEESIIDSLFNTWISSGYYFRQENTNSKVYVYSDKIDGESLLYDFSLLTGDSLKTIYNSYVIDSIIYEFIANKNRLVQYFSKECIVYKTIEGIGTLEDFLSPLYWGITGQTSFSNLLCFYHNSTLLYNSEEYCFKHKDYSGTDNQIHDEGAFLYPNPTSTTVHLIIPDYYIGAYAHLISSSGREVTKIKLNYNNNSFGLEKYSCGSYFIQICKENMILNILKLTVL